MPRYKFDINSLAESAQSQVSHELKATGKLKDTLAFLRELRIPPAGVSQCDGQAAAVAKFGYYVILDYQKVYSVVPYFWRSCVKLPIIEDQLNALSHHNLPDLDYLQTWINTFFSSWASHRPLP